MIKSRLSSEIKGIAWHKQQAAKSERFSCKVAEKLGLTVSDLRIMYKQKRAH